MRIIKYFMSENDGSVSMTWSEANEEIAKREAYNGEYTIEDDGQPEPIAEPSADAVLNILLGV